MATRTIVVGPLCPSARFRLHPGGSIDQTHTILCLSIALAAIKTFSLSVIFGFILSLLLCCVVLRQRRRGRRWCGDGGTQGLANRFGSTGSMNFEFHKTDSLIIFFFFLQRGSICAASPSSRRRGRTLFDGSSGAWWWWGGARTFSAAMEH